MTKISDGGGSSSSKGGISHKDDLEQGVTLPQTSQQQKTTSNNPSTNDPSTTTIRIPLIGMQSYFPLKKVEAKWTYDIEPYPVIQQLLQDLGQGPIHKMNKAYRIIDAAIATVIVTIIAVIISLVATGQMFDGECTQASPCQYENKHLPLILIGGVGGLASIVLFSIGLTMDHDATKDVKQLCRDVQASSPRVSQCAFVDDCSDDTDAMVEITLLN